MFREEGLGAFYISLLPRLASVVPMISIQFGAYETIKKHYINEKREQIAKARAAASIRKLTNRFRSSSRSSRSPTEQVEAQAAK